MIKNILLLALTAIGIAILYWGGCILKQSQDALTWPQTRGHMIASQLVIHHLPKFIDSRANPARWYGTQVQYEYKVGAEEYLSDRLAFREADSPSPQDALKVMNKYRRAGEVTVFYNPKDPNQAVLQPGYIGNLFLILIIGGLLVLGGVFVFYSQSLEFKNEDSEHIRLGDSYKNQGKFEEAFFEYNYAIKIKPSSPMGYRRRGGLYFQDKNWDKAIADFNQAIAIAPKDALTYFSLAKVYLGKKEYDKALDNMHKAMAHGLNVEPGILEDIKKNLG